MHAPRSEGKGSGGSKGSGKATGKKGGRASLSHSRLAEPDSPITTLATQFQAHIYLPDPMPLYVCMGAMAGNMMTGNPIWLMLVGSSGCGKTEMLKSLMLLDRMVPVSSIKGEAALLSGVKKADQAEEATGGLLMELHENGCLVFMDFTSVLSKSREEVNVILGALRELYDKTWSRSIGGEGGRRLKHEGRVVVVAGVTHAIDRHHMVSSEMGERCLYFRYPMTDGYQESMLVSNRSNPEKAEMDLKLAVQGMFCALDLNFKHPTRRRTLEMWESDRIVSIAQLGARCRTYVPRDPYNKQIVDVPATEVATRFTGELTQLYLGMEYIGVSQEECWQAIEQVALDSMMLIRRVVLKAVRDHIGSGKTERIAKAVRISESACKRVLEDLGLLGVVERDAVDGWVVSDWARERMAADVKETDE